MAVTFFLSVWPFALLISFKPGDPAHLGDLPGAGQPGVPAGGRTCPRTCPFGHSFASSPTSPSFLCFPDGTSCVSLCFALLSFLPPSLLSFFFYFFLSHPCLFSFPPPSHPFLWLLCIFLSFCLPPTPARRHRDTWALHVSREAESNCGREGHFRLQDSAPSLPSSETWHVENFNSICTGE